LVDGGGSVHGWLLMAVEEEQKFSAGDKNLVIYFGRKNKE